MRRRQRFPDRVVIISDLHLGGEPPCMMSTPDALAHFIDSLSIANRPEEQLELVIAGDVVDFLAISPSEAWTPDPSRACEKLRRTASTPPFATVFDALGRFIAGDHALTLLVGNHDLELAMPPVQQTLLERLGASNRDVVFIDDGRAYRIGGLLVEHGNRYDGANQNDWTRIRAIASQLSRGERADMELAVSAGSKIVERVISPLKARYPFIDLLQPEGEVVALLLAAFEPGLILDLPRLGQMLRAQLRQGRNTGGLPPGRTQAVGAGSALPSPDPELRAEFGGAYDALWQTSEQVGAGDVFLAAWRGRKDGIKAILERGEDIPPARLRQIQLALRRMLLEDESQRLDGDTGPYGAAAERLRRDSDGAIEVVVMGHTHLPRHIGLPERATYINTGTWADVIRVPRHALEEGGEQALHDFLVQLERDQCRSTPATYADVRLNAEGTVVSAVLRRASAS